MSSACLAIVEMLIRRDLDLNPENMNVNVSSDVLKSILRKADNMDKKLG